MWRYAETNNSVTNHAEISGYLVFTLVYFGLVNFIIKPVFTGYFLKIYRKLAGKKEYESNFNINKHIN